MKYPDVLARILIVVLAVVIGFSLFILGEYNESKVTNQVRAEVPTPCQVNCY